MRARHYPIYRDYLIRLHSGNPYGILTPNAIVAYDCAFSTMDHPHDQREDGLGFDRTCRRVSRATAQADDLAFHITHPRSHSFKGTESDVFVALDCLRACNFQHQTSTAKFGTARRG